MWSDLFYYFFSGNSAPPPVPTMLSHADILRAIYTRLASSGALSVLLGGAPAWVASTVYGVGAHVLNGTHVYVCTVEGTSASSGGPTGVGTGIVDSGATWNYASENTVVFNYVLQDYPVPFARVRWESVREWDTKDSFGFDGSIAVDGFFNSNGDLLPLQFIDILNTLLHNNPLSLSYGQSVVLRHNSDDVITEPDGLTCHAVSKFQHLASD